MIKFNYSIYHWIVFWGVISIVCAIQWTVAGAISAIISTIILIGGLIFAWIRRQRNITHPFFIKVSLDPFNARPDLTLTDDVNLVLGDNRILISVRPRIGTPFDRINVRFVNRKFRPRWGDLWHYLNVNPNLVQITRFEDILFNEKGEDWRHSYFESESDNVGGFYGAYNPELTVKEGELAWYYIYVRANDIWEGYLSFEGSLEQRRSWRRIKARVNMPKLIK